MPNVIIYSSANCAYCTQAKQIFSDRNVPFTEIRIDLDPIQREKMMTLTGRRTVPQIFINDQHIGGCDDLIALMNAGKLDPLLAK